RKADRHGQPSSAQHPPRRTRDVALAAYRSGSTPPGSLAWYQSRHHSKVLPCMSYSPQALAGELPTLAARASDRPGSAPLYGRPLKFACLLLSWSPNEVAVVVPARQAYSHWASVGNRNSHSFGRSPDWRARIVSLWQKSSASAKLTLPTG